MSCQAGCCFQAAHVAVCLAVCSTHRAVVISADDRALTDRCTVFYFTPRARERTLVVLAWIWVMKKKEQLTVSLVIKAKLYGQHFLSTCRVTLFHCKLKSVVGRITTACSTCHATNFSVAS